MKSAREYKELLKRQGVFYTGTKLANELKVVLLRYVAEEDISNVYDPTCGNGNLLSVFGDDVRKYGQELDIEACEEARGRLKNAVIYSGDTLSADAFSLGGGLFADDAVQSKERVLFDAIVANPPFSVSWRQDYDDVRFCVAPCVAPQSRADWAFHLHILAHLSEGGCAVVLCYPGALYRGQREKEIRRWFVDNGYIHEVILYEGDYFDDTKIATTAIVVRKQRAERITFRDHARGIVETVAISQVKVNDYNLSPQSYVQEETEKREVSAEDLQRGKDAIISGCVKRLFDTAEFLALTDELEKERNAERFVLKVSEAVEELRKKYLREL